jgi:hypothetical protein
VAEETGMQVDSQEQSAAPDETSSSAGKVQANERLLFCAEVLIGYKCEVQVRGLCAREPMSVCCVGGWQPTPLAHTPGSTVTALGCAPAVADRWHGV